MFRKIGFGAAAALTVGMLAVGCSEDGDTIIQGGNAGFPDNFPGSQAFENYVADDGRAFSNQGQDILHGNTGARPAEAQIYWNVTNGQAIGLYTAEANQTLAGGGSGLGTSTLVKILYAVHFNGTEWGTPVAIRGFDANDQDDQTADFGDFAVCWINTSGTSDQNAAARNGDAVIVFTRNDIVPVGTTNEDANVRVWMTYFDVSAANAAASGTVVGGFNTQALAIDTDNQFTGLAPGGDDPDVFSIGFVSDSLRCSHEFGPRFSPLQEPTVVDSGDPTNFLSIVFAKEAGSGGTAVGNRLFAVAIDGTVAGNVLDDLAGTPAIITPGAGSFGTGDAVSPFFTVHNQHMFWNYTETTNGDTIATVSEFDETGAVDEAILGDAVGGAANAGTDAVGIPSAADVYGGDHNLGAVYAFFTQSGYNTDLAVGDGDAAADTDLMVAQIDLDATLAVQRAKIDAFDDTVKITANNRRGFNAASVAAPDNIDSFGTRLGRTREYITVLWLQNGTDLDTDAADANTAVNLVPFVTVVQTRLPAAQGATVIDRDLDDSIFDNDTNVANFQGLAVPAQTAGGANARANVGNVEFQLDLVVGEAESQNDDPNEHCDPACGIQSNAYRMNFIYTQFDNGAAAASERLLTNGVEVVLGETSSTAVDAPTASLVFNTEEIVDTREGDGATINYAQFNAFAVDAGDQTRDTAGDPTAESGRVLVFYTLNGNNPDDNDAVGAFLETRGFVWDADDVSMISTDRGIDNFDQFGSFQGVQTTSGSGTGTHFAGSRIDVIWTEQVDRTGAMRLVTRSYDKGAINDNATANDSLEDRFTPNLVGGTAEGEPVQIDNRTNGVLLSTLISQTFPGTTDEFVVARSGSTVGVYFTEDEHLYYSDTTTGATGWDSTNGIPAPQLVDNDSANGARIYSALVYLRPNCADNLTKSQAFYLRDDVSQSIFLFGGRAANAVRSYVRVHN